MHNDVPRRINVATRGSYRFQRVTDAGYLANHVANHVANSTADAAAAAEDRSLEQPRSARRDQASFKRIIQIVAAYQFASGAPRPGQSCAPRPTHAGDQRQPYRKPVLDERAEYAAQIVGFVLRNGLELRDVRSTGIAGHQRPLRFLVTGSAELVRQARRFLRASKACALVYDRAGSVVPQDNRCVVTYIKSASYVLANTSFRRRYGEPYVLFKGLIHIGGHLLFWQEITNPVERVLTNFFRRTQVYGWRLRIHHPEGWVVFVDVFLKGAEIIHDRRGIARCTVVIPAGAEFNRSTEIKSAISYAFVNRGELRFCLRFGETGVGVYLFGCRVRGGSRGCLRGVDVRSGLDVRHSLNRLRGGLVVLVRAVHLKIRIIAEPAPRATAHGQTPHGSTAKCIAKAGNVGLVHQPVPSSIG